MTQSQDITGPFYFIGLAGTGMSAIAQYLSLSGEKVSGSDRRFGASDKSQDQVKLEKMQIQCLPQDGSSLNRGISTVIISTAIEEDNPDLKKARNLGLRIIHRSDALAWIASQKKSICVSGTSGKSTTTAMIYHILKQCGRKPSLLTGAGIQDLINEGKIGNADFQEGQYVVMEADESDGSLVKYHPTIGLCLNIDRDHKEYDELEDLFNRFRSQTQDTWIVNSSQRRTKRLTESQINDFGEDPNCGYYIHDYHINNFQCQFKVNKTSVTLPIPGLHNAYNATAAISAAVSCGISIDDAAQAISTYPGIHRRMQLLGQANDVTLIDDYAHNPAKIIAAIQTAQSMSPRIHAYFQPHGFAPTQFMRQELIQLLSESLRPEDTMWMSDIYYVGGTAKKDISAEDLILDLAQSHSLSFYHADREVVAENMSKMSQSGDIILLMGARDPSLEDFARQVWDIHLKLKNNNLTKST